MIKKYYSLFASIFLILAVNFFIGYVTKDEINTWYDTLHKSLLTPPNYWFSIVWTILYTIIAICGWIILE